MNDITELYVYIDESGNMDFRKNERYFVVCALIVDKNYDINLSHIVKHIIHEKVKKIHQKELHATKMSLEDKIFTINHIIKQNFSISYIIFDKERIHVSFFQHKNSCFNYMVYLLLEKYMKRIQILNIYITIDNRNVKTTSKDSLEEYLYIELIKINAFCQCVHVRYGDSEQHKNLQVVDLFSNSIYTKFNYNKSLIYSLFQEKIDQKIVFHKLFDKVNEED